jgi:hypothetical protein
LGQGWYLSVWKLVPLLGLLLLWARTTAWADEDAQGLKLNAGNWNAATLLGGGLGLLLAVLVPQYALGLLAALMAYGFPLGLYIRERNERVPDSAKVMTPAHIQSLVVRGLALVGIHVATGKGGRDLAVGPPIRFIGKSISGRGRMTVGRSRPRSRAGLWRRKSWCTTPSCGGRPTCTLSRGKMSSRCGTGLTG